MMIKSVSITSFLLAIGASLIFSLLNTNITLAAGEIECDGTCRSLVGGCQSDEFPMGTGLPLCDESQGLVLCCGKKATGQAPAENDCMGFCVPVNQCAPGAWPAGAISDPKAKGSCKAVPNTVCCGQQIVTPQGQAPGSTSTDSASDSGAQAQKSVDTQVGSDCREPTTGLNFPCIQQGNPQAVVTSVIARLVNWILTMTGVIFLAMFVWGGIAYMTAGGDSSRAEKARKVLVNAFIGTAIILGSYVILDWVFTTLITAIG
jgi:hypothetical protein